MALSTLDYPANGTGPYPFHSLDYSDIADLSAEVNGTPVSATFDEDRREMTLAATPAAGTTVTIRRTTPRLEEERRTQFLDLPDGAAGLSGALLDQDYRQNLFVALEGRDVATEAPAATGLELGEDMQWDAASKRIESLSAGAVDTDVVVKSQLDAVTAGPNNLPSVTGADNDDGLFVVSGAWAKRLPANCRTSLMLGSAAVLTAGVGANNVPQFDASSPPRYPTADGRNIDLTNHAIQTEINKRGLATVLRVRQAKAINNNIDTTLSTWMQNSTSRIAFNGTAWTNRVELNNSAPDVNGNFSPGRFDLTAGTWRVKWQWLARLQSTTPTYRFGWTNNDDTSGQTVYYDSGPLRNERSFSAGQSYYMLDSNTLMFASASAFSIAARAASTTSSAGTYDLTIILLFQKVSSSVLI